jgi:hypothetical protein
MQDRRRTCGKTAAKTAHQRRLRPLHLAGPSLPTELSHPFDDVQHAVKVCLGQIAPMRIDRQNAVGPEMSCFDKRPALAFGTKPKIFELYEHTIGGIVV